jgi:hypothetical protein
MSEQIVAPLNGSLYQSCFNCRYACKKPSTGLLGGPWLAECREAPPLQLVVPARNGDINIITQWPVVGDKHGFFCSHFGEKRS